MPRRRRGLADRTCYHLTHRCHKREFLFKFAKDRERYTDLLRETVDHYRVDLLNYGRISVAVEQMVAEGSESHTKQPRPQA